MNEWRTETERNTCPECGAAVQSTDTQCMQCGVNLVEARRRQRRKVQQQSLSARTVASAQPTGGDAATSPYTTDGETSEETRLRIFDQQEAQRLAAERVAALVTAAIVGIPGFILLALGLRYGWAVGLIGVGSLTPADLRSGAILTDHRLLAIILIGLGLAGIMSTAGLVHRAMTAGRAVQEVKRGEKPTIVSLNWLTYYGLLLVAIFCPPLGVILGILLKFSSDQDIKNTAGTMIIISLVVMAILVVNALLGLAEGLKSAQPPQPAAPE